MIRRMGVVVACVLALVAAGCGGSDAPTPAKVTAVRTPTRADLTRIADAVRKATNAPGAIVAVQVGAKPPTIVAVGNQQRSGPAMEPDTPFLTNSVSKAFTAATVLALVRDGKLALDDPVDRFVPGWDPRITVRMLLDHSSGLRSWGNKDDPDTMHEDRRAVDFNRRFTPAESIEPVRVAPLLATPGTRTHYSNASSILAGEVVTAVTGETLGTAIRTYVVDPLHLPSTGYAPEGLEPRPGVPGVLWLDDAKSTEVDTSQFPQTSLLTLSGPSIGVVSDAPDLLAFARAFLRGDFPDARLARTARRIDGGGAGLGVIGFTPTGYCIFDGCPPGSSFPRRGFAGNGINGAVRVVDDPKADATVLVFANSSERGSLDPFVIRTFASLRNG